MLENDKRIKMICKESSDKRIRLEDESIEGKIVFSFEWSKRDRTLKKVEVTFERCDDVLTNLPKHQRESHHFWTTADGSNL